MRITALNRDQELSSVKDQRTIHTLSVLTVQFCSMKVAIDNVYTNRHGCAPVKTLFTETSMSESGPWAMFCPLLLETISSETPGTTSNQ